MTEPPLELPTHVCDLARLTRATLAGESVHAFMIDTARAQFAIDRHRCGPLLQLASQAGAQTEDAAKAILSEHWSDNRRQHLRNLVSTERVAGALARAAIPALIFKGAPLARALYPDPLWRHCGDVDVLVPARLMVEALKALTEAGFRSEDSLFSLPPTIQHFVLAITRDVPVDDSWTQSHVEVHSRFLFSKRLSQFLADRDHTMRPQPIAPDGSLAAPAMDVGLALYLILHGCISGWCRLKWLIDLIPLLETLGPKGRQSLADDAERSRTAVAVKASLVLLRAVFGELDLHPLDAWIGERRGAAAVRLRAGRYAAWLGGDGTRVPLTTRNEIFKSTVLLNDQLPDQIMTILESGFSSGVRQIASTTSRRLN
jgi:Uncharacterised nucleotidyltransferase